MSKIIGIFIRPLSISDAEVSYKWRNDPRIWQHTGSRPNKIISLSVEQDWIRSVLIRTAEKRFAICVSGTDEYVGNVQLTGIKDDQAEFHIFIGEPSYWGHGIGEQATTSILKIAFDEFNLKKIYLFVGKDNIGAIKLYKKTGFHIETESDTQYRMVIEKSNVRIPL
jgi:RimJ/RimL family protein N-acetyltransferase